MATREQQAAQLQHDWDSNPRWQGIVRTYTAADVVRLRGSLTIEHTLAKRGAQKLWHLVNHEPFVNALGAMTGNQALQQVNAGLKAIYLSGGQDAGEPGPDDLSNAMPLLLRHINATLGRADQLQWSAGKGEIDYFAPIVADANAGHDGALNIFERVKSMIDAGAAAVHVDDQFAAVNTGGKRAGKVLVPTREALDKLMAARLAADVMGSATLVMARTDAEGAALLTSDIDANDQPFCTGARTREGYYQLTAGIEQAVARALAYAPFADLLWCETGKPDLMFARQFAQAVHARFPGKLLAYNCSPTFNWKKNLDDATIARFQKELGAMGYKFQFIALAGSHAVNYSMFNLAHGYARRQMSAFVELQEAQFQAADKGFTAAKHQREVGAGYIDAVTEAIRRHQGSCTGLHVGKDSAPFLASQKVA